MVRVNATQCLSPARPTSPTSPWRHDVSVHHKRQICRLAEQHQELSHRALTDLIETELQIRPSQSTVSRILLQKHRWTQALQLSRRRLRPCAQPRLEAALVAWCHYFLDHNGVLTYSILQAQGKELGTALGVTNFTYSDGWVYRFCQRNGIKCHKRVGEAASANLANVELARNSIPMVLAMLGAHPNDVFNCDETGLVLGAQPLKTLAFGRVSGCKRAMDRITLMICCNATGTERMKPMIVAKP